MPKNEATYQSYICPKNRRSHHPKGLANKQKKAREYFTTPF